MDTIIKNYLEQLKVGRKQSYKNLSLYPIPTIQYSVPTIRFPLTSSVRFYKQYTAIGTITASASSSTLREGKRI